MCDRHHGPDHQPRPAALGRREAVIAGAGLVITSFSAAAPAAAQTAGRAASGAIAVTSASARPAMPGSADYFTGSTRVQPLFPASEPGARTAWHTHPLGQVLIVTAGSGWVQPWGGPKQEIQQDDVVWIPPGLKHWHGATATAGMTHTAIQERLDGRNVDWMEHVTDEQYRNWAKRAGRAPRRGHRHAAPAWAVSHMT